VSPIADLPYGVAMPPDGEPRCVTRIGDRAIDLSELDLPVPPDTFDAGSLNGFMALGPEAWLEVHARLAELADPALPGWPLDEVALLLPIAVGDYVDFYSSRFHAENVSRLFRPDAEPLLPNWRALPVGYHGRAGTVVVSGTGVRHRRGRDLRLRADERLERARDPGLRVPAAGAVPGQVVRDLAGGVDHAGRGTGPLPHRR
jgi:fumarylacetoacetase